MSAAARFRYTLVAGATAVVIGTGFTVVGLSKHADAEARVPSSAQQPLAGGGSASTGADGDLLPPDPAAPASAPISPSAPASPSATPSKPAATPSTPAPAKKKV